MLWHRNALHETHLTLREMIIKDMHFTVVSFCCYILFTVSIVNTDGRLHRITAHSSKRGESCVRRANKIICEHSYQMLSLFIDRSVLWQRGAGPPPAVKRLSVPVYTGR